MPITDDQEYSRIFNRLSDFGTVQGHAVVINGTPVEVFPVDISPIIDDALNHPIRKRVGGVLVKVASAEHLLLEALRVYPTEDKGRAIIVDAVADPDKLLDLFERLDHGGTFQRRYREITNQTS